MIAKTIKYILIFNKIVVHKETNVKQVYAFKKSEYLYKKPK